MLCLIIQVALLVKNPPANAGEVRDSGLTPGSGRSPGRGHGSPLQYSYVENPMDRGRSLMSYTVHRVAKKRLSMHACIHHPVIGWYVATNTVLYLYASFSHQELRLICTSSGGE